MAEQNSQPVSIRVARAESPARERLYEQIKELEGRIPIPEPKVRVWIGSLDAASGAWTWGVKVTRERTTIPGTGSEVRLIGEVVVNAVNVDLVFRVRNRQADFAVTVDGATVNAPPAQSEVVVPIGRANEVSFTVRSGMVSYTGELTITRFAAGVGAITIDALPTALIYCPLQGTRRENVVTYVQTEWLGTRQAFVYESEDAETLINADTLQKIGEAAGKIGGGFGDWAHDKKTDYPSLSSYAGTIGLVLKAFSVLIAGLGSEEERETLATETTDSHEVQNTIVRSDLIFTPPGANLGERSEIFVLLQNVRAAWLAVNGELTIAILSTPESSAYQTAALEADLAELDARRAGADERGSRTRLMAETIRALLRLNPFWSPPNLPLPLRRPMLRAPRFRLVDDPHTYNRRGPLEERVQFATEIIEDDLTQKTNTFIRVTDIRKGWLSFLGVGPSEDKTITWKSSMSNLTRRSSGLRISVEVSIKLSQDEPFRVTGIYDRLFGTVAFLSADLAQPPEAA